MLDTGLIPLNRKIDKIFDVLHPPFEQGELAHEQHLLGLDARCRELERGASKKKGGLAHHQDRLLVVARRYSESEGPYSKIQAAYLASMVASRPANGSPVLAAAAEEMFDRTIGIILETTDDPRALDMILARAAFCALLLPVPKTMAKKADEAFDFSMSSLVMAKGSFFTTILTRMDLQASPESPASEKLLAFYHHASSDLLDPLQAALLAEKVACTFGTGDGLFPLRAPDRHLRFLSAAAFVFETSMGKLFDSREKKDRKTAKVLQKFIKAGKRDETSTLIRKINKQLPLGAKKPISKARRKFMETGFS